MWDIVKVVLRTKFIALNAYLKRRNTQINNLSFHLRKLEKEEHNKFKIIRIKEIIKIGVEINKIESSKSKRKKLMKQEDVSLKRSVI